MDTIIYIIVASLTIGGVLGRITSYRDISVLTKKTEADKAELGKRLDEIREDVGGIFDRLGALERGYAEQMAKAEAQGKQIDRIESMLERMIGR